MITTKPPKVIKSIDKALAAKQLCYLSIPSKDGWIQVPCYVSSWMIPIEAPFGIDASIVSAGEPSLSKKTTKKKAKK